METEFEFHTPVLRGKFEDAWEAFHAAHPRVYDLFARFAREAAESGRERFGAKMIWERMRWYTTIEAGGKGEDWRLNNNYITYYAREFMRRNPQYGDLFELRRMILVESEATD